MKLAFTKLLFLCTILLFSLNSIIVSAQQIATPKNKFVQFYVIGMTDGPQSRAIDQFMRAQPNILISRADPNTRLYFAIFPVSAGFGESDFVAWFSSQGYQISCYREGIHGEDRVLSKEAYTCD